MFENIFTTGEGTINNVYLFLLCIVTSLFIGLLYLLAYSFKSRSSSSFRASLVLLPAIVAVVIMMVNGNIGVGVAIAGAFSLVKFRSAQGTAKEISVIFMTMCSGLIIGVGYIGYAVLFTLTMCLVLMLCNYTTLKKSFADRERILKITIPEDLDFYQIFDEILSKYTTYFKLIKVRTTDLGSLYNITYDLTLKKSVNEKNFLDELRIRNGNLEVSLSHSEKNDL